MVVDSQLLITRFVDPMQPNAIAIWCPSAVCDDGAGLSDPRAPNTPACRAGAEAEAQRLIVKNPPPLGRAPGPAADN